MRKNINIEVEGQELILKNKAGDYVIIPKKYRTKVQGMIKDNCHGCIDSLVETLPAMSDYAQDGTVFPSDDPITLIKPSGERVNTTTGSEFYRTHYNSKLIGKQNEDKSWNLIDEIYRGSDLPEVVISSKIIPNTLGDYSNQFSKQNPQDKFFANKQAAHNKEFYSAPLWAQQAVGGYNDKRKANDKKSDEEEYNQQRNDFIAEKLLKRTPFEGMDNRINWMNKFTHQELETIKKSKYSSELEEGALQKFENFILGMNTSGIKFKSKGTTAEEAEADQANPLNILQPLSIPTKAVQSAYKKNYSFSDAMKGKANNASIVEDIITDPLNLVGIGLAGKLSKADKVIDATKAGSKVLNKIDDVVKHTTNQLDEIPHEIILDNNFRDLDNINLQRTSNKVKKEKIPYEDIELGNDLYLRKNPSRTTDPEKLLGKNRAIISVKNKNNTEYIDLKSWKDVDGSIYYYMSANMPSSKIKAGKAYLELEKHIPKGASLLENSSLSYDSLLNILKQTKNPKFETFIKGRIPMNDMSVSNKLKSIGDKSSDSIDLGFYSKDIADNAVIELNELLNKYNLPKATVVKRTVSTQPAAHLPYEKKDIFEIELPNIGLKKLYSIIGLTSTGAAIQSQNQNKTEQ